MSNILGIIILTGAACSSPMEQAVSQTTAYKVPCAVVIKEPVTNPFKIVQEPNVASTTKAVPKYSYVAKKKKRKKRR